MTHAILIALYPLAAALQVVAILRDPPTRIRDVSWSGKPLEERRPISTSLIALGVIIGSVASIIWLVCN